MKILVGLDLESGANELVDRASTWAARLGAVVDLAHVDMFRTTAMWEPTPEVQAMLVAGWARVREEKEARLRELMLRIPETNRGRTHVVDGLPAEGIVDLARDYVLLLVGTHARTGMAHFWLGSVAERVVRTSSVPLGVVKGTVRDHPRVLVTVDVRESADDLLAAASNLVQRLGATVDVLYVEELPARVPSVADPHVESFLIGAVQDHYRERDQAIQAAFERFPPLLRGERLMREGPVAARVAEEVERVGYDAVIAGTHQRRGLAHVFLGSVAERLVRRSPTTVFLLPGPR